MRGFAPQRRTLAPGSRRATLYVPTRVSAARLARRTRSDLAVLIFFIFSTFYFSAKFGLPFGSSCFYVRSRKTGNLEPVSKVFDPSIGCFEREEALFCQFMNYGSFPEALNVASAFNAGPGQLPFGRGKWPADLTLSLPGQERSLPLSLDTRKESRDWSKRTVAVFNYHGFYHNDNRGHQSWCQQHTGDEDGDLRFNDETNEEDSLLRDYAQAMSSVHEGLDFTYTVLTPCSFFHGNPLPGVQGENSHCSLRKYLEKEHGDKCVFTRRYENGVGESKLVSDIVAEKVEGFITIEGGEESCKDTASWSFAFCHTRDNQSVSELGSQALSIFAERFGGDKDKGEKMLRKRLSASQATLTRKHFSGLNTISSAFFRFLVKERRLTNFKVVHFMECAVRHFLTPWVLNLLENRWKIKKGLMGKVDCSEFALKIILNSLVSKMHEITYTNIIESLSYLQYGYAMLEDWRYTSTYVSSEDSLMKGKNRPLKSVSLLGSVPRKERKGTKSQYRKGRRALVLVETSRPEARTKNLVQTSAQILNNSRTLFYGQILTILRYLDPEMCELTYTDTDSSKAAKSTVTSPCSSFSLLQ